MKILVCVSKAPDTTSKIAFKDGNTTFDEAGVQFIVNPYDEWYALVRAIELKEANGGTVTIVTVGVADHDPIIRKALAIGADNAVRIDKDPVDSYDTAAEIANYAKAENFDMIFCGKETINHNGAIVGGMLAEMLDLPYVSLATKLEANGTEYTISREAGAGVEVVGVSGPVVLSAAKGMAEQRIPNMRGIMAARSKPLTVLPASNSESLTSISQYSLPEEKGACTYIDAENPAELIRLLNEEAKVL